MDLGDPAFQPGQVLIAWRQRPGGDQDRAQVPQRLAVGQLVEGGVGERPLAGAELAQDRRGALLLSQPAQHGGRAFVAGQVVMQCLQARPDRAVPSASRSRSRCRSWCSGAHRPACRRPGCPQPGQLRQDPASGRAQAEQSGWSAVPPRTGRDRAAARAAGPALLCRPGTRACRWPWRSRTGPVWPQIVQVRICQRPAALAQRPVRGAGADPAAPAAR